MPDNVKMQRTTVGMPGMPTLVSPLTIRQALVEEAGALAALLGRAYPSETWSEYETEIELFRDESVKATLVVVATERLVATASLQVLPGTPECGQLRWVGTEFDRRREGLARALVIAVLSKAGQAGCREVWLKTTTDLLGAITLYLQLGFEPIVESDADQLVWKQVLSQLSV